MKVAVISDIHGNLTALQAVLNDQRVLGVDEVYCLGDIVGYGPRPRECLGIVQACAKGIVRGNHEEATADIETWQSELNDYAVAGIRYSAQQLRPQDSVYVKALPETLVLPALGIACAHGAFVPPYLWRYTETEEDVKAQFAHLPARIGCIGHTHIPFVFGSTAGLFETLPDALPLGEGQQFLINVGSVGQPRDGDCRASYGVFTFSDGNAPTFDLRRVFYDIAQVAADIRQAGLPTFLAERLFQGQ